MQVLHPDRRLPSDTKGYSSLSYQSPPASAFVCFPKPALVRSCRHCGCAYGHCACAAGRMCSDSGGGGMSSERQTATHLYEEKDRIGKGGSCDVYCGVEKGTGRRHALKALREASPAQQTQLLQEAETLGKLSCSAIVKMYGLDYELESGRPVMTLEYCNAGSLHSFLQQPENARGLDDKDFLLLLNCLVQAQRYLRAAGIVHRDIKPGNILRHVYDSGICAFKLSDFGTSREAPDTEQLNSIVGTEEYLHPVLYKSAFFGQQTHSALNPVSGELWSVGCTLYHAMTASVPFRPLGGPRNNRKAMLVMISQKPPGCISGDQRMDGTFRWETAPPADCRMSESLRQKVTPLLQHLMERDSSRQWGFATFLDESQRILRMRGFHVCDTECGQLFRLYLEPKQSVAELQDSLAYHTEIPAGQQLLFYRVQPLLSQLGPQAHVGDLPATQEDQPFLLLSPRIGLEGRCGPQMAVQPQLLIADASLEEDVTSAFKACSDLYTQSLTATTFSRLPNLLFLAHLALKSTLTSCQSTVETRFRVLSATCQERQSRLAMISQVLEAFRLSSSSSSSSSSSASSSASSPASSGQPRKLSEAKRLCDQLRDNLWQLKYRLDEFRRSAAAADSAKCTSPLPPTAAGQEDSGESMRNVYERAKELWQAMQERRQKIPLSRIEQDKHKGDRNTLNVLCQEGVKKMKALQEQRKKLLTQYRSQVRQLHERLEAAQEMDQEVQRAKEESEYFSTLLDEIWSTEWEHLQKIAEGTRLSSVSPVPVPSPLHSQLGELISEGLPALETFHLTLPEASTPK